jgi:SAM-dependent methyltransferase
MIKNNSRMFCDACQSEMHEGLSAWHFVCPACKFERSTLEQKINQVQSIDEIARENALRSLREHNFNLLAGWLKETSNSNGKPTLLDVGSAHGWFLQKVKEDFDAQGIEPDQAMADFAIKKGLNVRKGYFPAVLDHHEKFDFIIFNDVLEHIPDVKNIVKSCSDYLKDDGILVINVPDTRGVFYKASKFLKKLGMAGSFDRMWQVGLPSPHLYYFDKNSISKIAAQAGFKIVKEHSLNSIALNGLFDRINYAGGNKLMNYLLGIAIFISSPALKIMHSDISVWFFKKN